MRHLNVVRAWTEPMQMGTAKGPLGLRQRFGVMDTGPAGSGRASWRQILRGFAATLNPFRSRAARVLAPEMRCDGSRRSACLHAPPGSAGMPHGIRKGSLEVQYPAF